MNSPDDLGIDFIFEEFTSLSEVDHNSHYSISETWSHLGSGEDRQFGLVQKSDNILTDAEKRKIEKDEAMLRARSPKLYSDRKQHKNSAPNQVLTEEKVAAIKFLLLTEKVKDVAIKYGVSNGTISQINNGLTWRHVRPLSSLPPEIEMSTKKKPRKNRRRFNVWEKFGDGIAMVPTIDGGFVRVDHPSVKGRMHVDKDFFTPYREAVDDFLPDEIFQYIYMSGFSDIEISFFHSIYARIFCKGRQANIAANIVSRIFRNKPDSLAEMMERRVMVFIKLGDPQPYPCSVCKASNGYVHSISVRRNYTTRYNSEGKIENAEYQGDEREIYCSAFAFCSKCNSRLGFKVLKN